jgi:hypothetical protein
MTDREMLELAAKAGGYARHEYVENSARDGRVVTGHYDSLLEVCINPLTDDGDALRLAVQLMIRVSVNRAFRLSIPGSVSVEYIDRDGFYCALGEAVTNGDPYAATRRAITRAAAEIGRQMEEQS